MSFSCVLANHKPTYTQWRFKSARDNMTPFGHILAKSKSTMYPIKLNILINISKTKKKRNKDGLRETNS